MLVGHLAVGLAAKKAEPHLSLGTYVGAALLADLLFFGLWLGGVERAEIGTGRGAAAYWHAIDIGWSHSLVTGVAGAALAALLTIAVHRQTRAAAFVALAVASHWVLDVISHVPDMPLVPQGGITIGMALWSSLPLTLALEGGAWLAALAVYSISFPARSTLGLHGFWGVAALLTLAWYNNVAGAPPADARSAPVASLVFFSGIVLWAYWVDRLRK